MLKPESFCRKKPLLLQSVNRFLTCVWRVTKVVKFFGEQQMHGLGLCFKHIFQCLIIFFLALSVSYEYRRICLLYNFFLAGAHWAYLLLYLGLYLDLWKTEGMPLSRVNKQPFCCLWWQCPPGGGGGRAAGRWRGAAFPACLKGCLSTWRVLAHSSLGQKESSSSSPKPKQQTGHCAWEAAPGFTLPGRFELMAQSRLLD